MDNFENYSQSGNLQNNISQQNINYNRREKLPNADIILILGIISIISCWCYGVIGLTLGIIAIVMANSSIKAYQYQPERFTETSYNNVKAGRVCAIIGTVFSGLFILITIAKLVLLGTFMLWGSGLLE